MGYNNNNYNKSSNDTVSLPEFEFNSEISYELIGVTADEIAKSFKDKNANKSTQLRKFYDEIIKLSKRSERDGFDKIQIHLHMLKAKVAYAQGRNLVTPNFNDFIVKCIDCSTCNKSLGNFKLLFESVLGFYKLH